MTIKVPYEWQYAPAKCIAALRSALASCEKVDVSGEQVGARARRTRTGRRPIRFEMGAHNKGKQPKKMMGTLLYT